MPNHMPSDGEIHQMFALAAQGLSRAEIARILGVWRQTTSKHLAGMYLSRYSKELRIRIGRTGYQIPVRATSDTHWIPLQDVGYFLPNRARIPSVIGYLKHGLRFDYVNHTRHTTRQWIREFLEARLGTLPEGLLVCHDALRMFCSNPLEVSMSIPSIRLWNRGIEKAAYRWSDCTQVAKRPVEPPANVVSRAVKIAGYTGLPFVSVAAEDWV